MEQQISDNIFLTNSYKIDKQFFVCLNDIFTKYDSDVEVSVEASNKHTKYRFSSINELLEYSPKLSDKIEELSIDARFPIPNSISYNQIEATFTNSTEFFPSRDRITFDFCDPNGYLILKNQIETLLRNCKLGYSKIARIPLLALLSTCLFWFIYAYTNRHNIVYPKDVQSLIWSGWFLCLSMSIVSPTRKLKRFLYPFNELHIGINTDIYLRGKYWRDLVHVSMILAFIVGIAVNFVSNLML